MARRRINTRFLGMFFSVIVLLAIAAVLARKFLHHESPQPYIAAGEAALKDEDWAKAVANLGKAVSLMPKDPNLLVEYGTALSKMSPDSPEIMGRAISAWRQATQLNPDFAAAWLNLLNVYEANLSQIEMRQSGATNREQLNNWYTLVRETAGQLTRLDPKNPRAAAIVPSLDIRMWLMNVPIPQTAAESAMSYDKRPTDEQKVNLAVVQLLQMLHDDPTNTPAGLLIAEARIHQAQLASAADRTADAGPLFAQAAGVYDEAIKSHPANLAELYIAQAEILALLIRSDQRPDFQKTYEQQFHQNLELAQAAVDPKKNLNEYRAVKLRWALVLSAGDPAGAEKVYRDIIALDPMDYRAKTELAKLLDRTASRREEALQLLEQIPSLPPAGVSAAKRSELVGQIADAQLVGAQIKINQLIGTSDPVLRTKLIGEIHAVLDGLAPNYGQAWGYLKLKGKFQLTQGSTDPAKYRDAIQTLQAADEAMTHQTAGKDTDLLMLEADAYQHGDQSSKAITVLEEAMRDPQIANQPTPHLALASLYLDEKNTEKAKPQLEWLSVRFPNNPDVIKMQIRGLDPIADHDAILALFQKLPETSTELIKDKAVTAHRIGDDADAISLLKGLHAADPKDTSVAYSLGVMQLQSGKKDDANQTLTESLKANPGDPMLVLLQKAVNGESRADLTEAAKQQINEGFTDPYAREMRLADLAAANGSHDEELSHVKAAQAIRPNEGAVLDRLFRIYLSAGQFDLAQPFLEPLTKLDFDQAHGLLYKFRFALAKGDLTTAQAVGQQLISEFPEFSESWEAMGEALQGAGAYDDASTKYQEALSRQSTNVQALRGLIACSYQLNKLEDAKRYIDDARKKFPNDPAYRELEVQHVLLYGDPETVLDSVQQAVKEQPDNPRNYQLAATAFMKAAEVKSNKGDNDAATKHVSQARDILQQAITRWPDNLQFVSAFSEACVDAGDLPAAEAAIKALADRPKWKDLPGPSIVLGEAYIKAGKIEAAEAPLRDAVAKSKNDPNLQMRLAQVLMSQRKYDQALTALDTNKTLPAVLKMRAEILLNLNRGADAEAEVAPAQKAAPNDSSLADLLTFIYYREGKTTEARALADKSITAYPDDLRVHYLRGMMNLRGPDADLDAAIADFKFVIDRNTNEIESRLALADAYVLKNDPDDGIHVLESALTAAPKNKLVRLKLVDMYSLATPPRYTDAIQALTDGLAMPQHKDDIDMLRDLAAMYSRSGNDSQAVATMRNAMSLVKDNSFLIHDYLVILLSAKNYDLVLTQSEPLLSDPKVPWWVYDMRGQAKAGQIKAAGTQDYSAASAEFDTALTLALAQGGRPAASGVAGDIKNSIGVDKAIELIAPKAQNSASWKLITIPLYESKQDHSSAIAAAESALKMMDSLSGPEQDELLAYAASLYVTANPPMTDKAMDIFQQILKRRPDDYMSMNNIACMYADSAQPTQALKYSQQAYDLVLKAHKVEPLIYDTQGWALILNNRDDEGIDILQKVAETAEFPDIHYHLAKGYLHKHEIDGAQRELKLASTLMDQAIAAKRNVDASLRAKIDQASKEADQMLQSKPVTSAG